MKIELAKLIDAQFAPTHHICLWVDGWEGGHTGCINCSHEREYIPVFQCPKCNGQPCDKGEVNFFHIQVTTLTDNEGEILTISTEELK